MKLLNSPLSSPPSTHLGVEQQAPSCKLACLLSPHSQCFSQTVNPVQDSSAILGRRSVGQGSGNSGSGGGSRAHSPAS
jgi:hypothetical protein